jgi:hypothetical protein
MELVLNRKKEVTIKNGDVESKILVSVPTMAMQKALQDELDACKEDGKATLSVMLKWSSQIGLPEEVVQALAMEDFLAFVEWISGSKKK